MDNQNDSQGTENSVPVTKTNNKTIQWLFLAVAIVLLIIGGFGAGVWVGNRKDAARAEPTPALSAISPTVSSAASLTKTLPTQTELGSPSATVSPIEADTTQVQAEEAIKSAMAAKYSKNAEDVTITVSDYQPSFAKGGVQFAGEMGGGWFLAAEVGGEWVIVQDGNGTVTCEVIEPYNFPVSMVSECWSETSQELVNR
jgi:flagellar basal body-associated protein FliL